MSIVSEKVGEGRGFSCTGRKKWPYMPQVEKRNMARTY
jgi:hypothetical protein